SFPLTFASLHINLHDYCDHLYCVTYLSLLSFFFFNDTATTEIYTLSLHDALPIFASGRQIAINGHIKFNLTIPLQQLNGLETLVIIMVANKYAFLQITRRRDLKEWSAFKKVISRRNIRRRITIPLTLSNLKLLRRITRTEIKFLPLRRYNLTLILLFPTRRSSDLGRQIAINGHIKFNLTIPLQQLNGLETLVIIMVANKYAFLQITRR